MASVLFTTRDYVTQVSVEVPTWTLGDLTETVERIIKTATNPLTPKWLASKLGPETTQRPTVLIIVRKFDAIITWGSETAYTKTHTSKAGINQIKDFRTRPAPFLRDGTCRG